MGNNSRPAGRYLEEFNVGDMIETAGRTVTETDIVMFAGLSGDYNPLHTDEEWAKNSPMGGRIAHGILVASIASGLRMQSRMTEGTAIALLDIKETFLLPTRAGDTIHGRITITEVRPSKSKTDRGIVKYDCDVINQKQETVIHQEIAVMLRRKP